MVPSQTDAAIHTALDPHVAINPVATDNIAGTLLVVLPGTGGGPAQYRLILRTGAARGYHAIGLAYPNPRAVGALCGGSADTDCFWNVRREIVTGTDLSSLVAANAPNSIVNRLQKLLAYLHTQYPTEGWGQYLVNGTVDWSRIVVAGHSQGGGHAAVIAKLYSVNRGVYFSSPPDWDSLRGAPASWFARTGATEAGRQYGFAHLQDDLVPYAQLVPIWSVLGLQAYGAPTSVDGSAAPYGNSHQLTTAAAPNYGGGSLFPLHGATVVDAATPLSGTGTPLFEPVWVSLCFP